MKGKKIELDVAGPLQMPDYDHVMLLDNFRVGGNAVTAPERGYFMYSFIVSVQVQAMRRRRIRCS